MERKSCSVYTGVCFNGAGLSELLSLAGLIQHGLEPCCNEAPTVKCRRPVLELHAWITCYLFHAHISRSFVWPLDEGHYDRLALVCTRRLYEVAVLLGVYSCLLAVI